MLMRISSSCFCLGILLHTIFLSCYGFQVSAANLSHNEAMMKKACVGNKGLCFWEPEAMEVEMEMEMEMEMDSEINRRVLMAQRKYISYETLKRDVVPCNRPGAAYYNCHAVGQANPYNRGCEVIAGCRHG